jgi:hypothetical protein
MPHHTAAALNGFNSTALRTSAPAGDLSASGSAIRFFAEIAGAEACPWMTPLGQSGRPFMRYSILKAGHFR